MTKLLINYVLLPYCSSQSSLHSNICQKILNLLHFKVHCNHLNICSDYVQLLNNHIKLTLLLMPAAVTFTSDSSTPSAGATPNHTAPFMISRHLKSLFQENLFCGSLLPEEPFNHGWLPKKSQRHIILITSDSVSWHVLELRNNNRLTFITLQAFKMLGVLWGCACTTLSGWWLIKNHLFPIISSICSRTQKNNPSDHPLL